LHSVEILVACIIFTPPAKMDPVVDSTPTCATGEQILQAFVQRMGRRYANGRATDHGPGVHIAVSILSS